LFGAIKGQALFSPTLVRAVARRAGLESEIQSEPAIAPEKQIAAALPLLKGGDPNRGQQLFIGKAGCSACHRVGKHGGLTGPDLTKVGAIRSGNDLIESIVAPSTTFAQGYEGYEIELPDGETVSGVRVGRGNDRFVLRNASGSDRRVGAKDVRKITRLEASIMPEGLLNALQPEEIRDLLAYLQNLK
jgi:putative heme-binding domain-containing protein